MEAPGVTVVGCILEAASASSAAAGAAFFRGEVTGRSGCRLAADHTGQTTGEGPGSCAGEVGDTAGFSGNGASSHAALFEAAKALGRDEGFAQHIAAGMAHRDAQARHKAVDLLGYLEKGDGAEKPDEQVPPSPVPRGLAINSPNILVKSLRHQAFITSRKICPPSIRHQLLKMLEVL